jgi:hypothetical protein
VLYKLIDIAVPPYPIPDPDLDRQPDENTECDYVVCDYVPDEIDELDVCWKKMYYLLVTTIGGLDAITMYFHVIGSGHVVWMVRLHVNLWRFRGEFVEAFNSIVSLRHNKNKGKSLLFPCFSLSSLCVQRVGRSPMLTILAVMRSKRKSGNIEIFGEIHVYMAR